jgi:hypothetical protein
MDVPVVIPSLSLQPEINGRPFPCCSLCPDVAAMTMDDALYNGKADSRALEFFLGVQPMEWQEHFFPTLLIEPRAVVPDVVNVSSVLQKCIEPLFLT